MALLDGLTLILTMLTCMYVCVSAYISMYVRLRTGIAVLDGFEVKEMCTPYNDLDARKKLRQDFALDLDGEEGSGGW